MFLPDRARIAVAILGVVLTVVGVLLSAAAHVKVVFVVVGALLVLGYLLELRRVVRTHALSRAIEPPQE